MLVRIIQFLIGGGLAGGGGYLVWTERALAPNLFPPPAAGLPWMLVGGIFASLAGVVLLVFAVAPRPNRAERLAAEAERRKETIRSADAFYSERARAADRDWRAGDLPPQPSPPQPPPPPPPPPSAAKPVAAAAPPSNPFPSAATLAPIPKAAEPPPLSPAAHPTEATMTPDAPVVESFPGIRVAIADGRLEEADRMLNEERDGGAQGGALADLTALAGDHAAAAGRQSHAKWLWRLALTRFKDCNAINSPAALAVHEKLRLADN